MSNFLLYLFFSFCVISIFYMKAKYKETIGNNISNSRKILFLMDLLICKQVLILTLVSLNYLGYYKFIFYGTIILTNFIMICLMLSINTSIAKIKLNKHIKIILAFNIIALCSFLFIGGKANINNSVILLSLFFTPTYLNFVFIKRDMDKSLKSDIRTISFSSMIFILSLIIDSIYLNTYTIFLSTIFSFFAAITLCITGFRKLSLVDPLTNCFNKRFLENMNTSFFKKNNILSLGIVCIDLDDFKSINDKYGHHEGDRVLKTFSYLLKQYLRKKDFVIRNGGDEFLVFIINARKDDLNKYISSLKYIVDRYNRLSNKGYDIKYSAGSEVWYKNSNISLSKMFYNVDNTMYKNKKEQKKQVNII